MASTSKQSADAPADSAALFSTQSRSVASANDGEFATDGDKAALSDEILGPGSRVVMPIPR
jgi:hypothetical protein